jgi:hypothetical protein
VKALLGRQGRGDHETGAERRDAVGADRETLCATERTGCLGQVVKARGVAGSTAEHDPQVLDQAEIRPEHLEEPLGPARGNRLILGSERQTNRAARVPSVARDARSSSTLLSAIVAASAASAMTGAIATIRSHAPVLSGVSK